MKNYVVFHPATIITVNTARQVILDGHVFLTGTRIVSIGKGMLCVFTYVLKATPLVTGAARMLS